MIMDFQKNHETTNHIESKHVEISIYRNEKQSL